MQGWSERSIWHPQAFSVSKRELRSLNVTVQSLPALTRPKQQWSTVLVLQHRAGLPSLKQSRKSTLFPYSARSPLAAPHPNPALFQAKGLWVEQLCPVRGSQGGKRAQCQVTTPEGTMATHQPDAYRFCTSHSPNPSPSSTLTWSLGWWESSQHEALTVTTWSALETTQLNNLTYGWWKLFICVSFHHTCTHVGDPNVASLVIWELRMAMKQHGKCKK